MSRKTFRLRLDPAACDGFGYCAELFPEFITRDEWGFPVIAVEPVPPKFVALGRQCVKACPRSALFLEGVAVGTRSKARAAGSAMSDR
jgi:ferredoxin